MKKECSNCHKIFKKQQNLSYKQWNARKYCSHQCFSKTNTTKFVKGKRNNILGEFKKGQTVGNKNSNWKGGITLIAKQIRNSETYKLWRSSIFERDLYTCQQCKEKGVYLHVNHIFSFSKILKIYNIKTLKEAFNCKLLWDVNNGETLCTQCHYKITFGRPMPKMFQGWGHNFLKEVD